MKKLSLLLLFALVSCSSVEQERITTFMNSPVGKSIIGIAATTGANAVDQFAASGKVDGKQLAQAALSGASAELRKAQTPAAPLNAPAAKEAAKDAVNNGTGLPAVSRQVAPAVAAAVADAVKNQNAPADLALEAAARGLDQAAAGQK